MSDINVTAGTGGTINVSTGTVVGPLPELQIAAGNGITVSTSGGVSTVSANLTALAIPANLADLADVQGGSQSGQLLSYNGTSWGGLTLALSDLSDVTGTPSSGQVLSWDGANWTASNGSGGNGTSGNLSGLSDVAFTTPNVGDTIAWDGGNWTAETNVRSINGFAQDVFLAAGAGAEIDSSNGTVTVSGRTLPNGGIGSWQAADGTVHLTWAEIHSAAASNYAIEIMQIGNQTSPNGSITVTEPEIEVTVTVDPNATELTLSFFPSSVDITTVDPDAASVLAEAVTIDLLAEATSSLAIPVPSLPPSFTSAGAFSVYGLTKDPLGNSTGYSLIGNGTSTAHGNPTPPSVLSADWFADAGVLFAEFDCSLTPHMRGFYPFGSLTFSVESTVDGTTWASAGNFTSSSGGVESFRANLTPAGAITAIRVQTTNPAGTGSFNTHNI